MGSWGNVEFEQLKNLSKKLDKMQTNSEQACIQIMQRLASEFLRRVKQRSPVDTGTLRRNWTVGRIEKQGNDYVVTIYNPTEYSLYQEYGHRKRNHKGWVQGRFMMTLSERELQAITPQLIDKKVEVWLKEVLND